MVSHSRPVTSDRLWKKIAAAVAIVIGFVLASRGGFQNKPLNSVNAQVFANPALNNFVLNTPFVVLKSLGQETLERPKYFSDPAKLKSFLNGSVRTASLMDGHRPVPVQNVVILIMESFGREYMGAVNGNTGYTPFLDSLAKKSLFFTNAYANSRRSIEGIPAVLSGMPALMNEPFITSRFEVDHVPGIAAQLPNYHSAFFHGGHNGTMHFDSYSKSAGFEQYFGASEYPDAKDDDGIWGIYDGPFEQWMARNIARLPEPFVIGFFSLSSHQPYRIPEADKNLYTDGPIPILKTVAYADHALAEFFKTAEQQSWYRHTLFVITADHASRPYEPRFDNEISRFRVPIIFFHPDFTFPAEIDREAVVEQIDILPSILDFLGRPIEGSLLARSVFRPGPRTATVFVGGQYFEVNKTYFLHWPRGGEARMFRNDDPAQSHAVTDQPLIKEELFDRLKAVIQYYSESLLDNRWVSPKN